MDPLTIEPRVDILGALKEKWHLKSDGEVLRRLARDEALKLGATGMHNSHAEDVALLRHRWGLSFDSEVNDKLIFGAGKRYLDARRAI